MDVFTVTVAAVVLGTPALSAGYSDNDGVRIFTEYPCSAVIQAIDSDFDSEDQVNIFGLSVAVEELVSHLVRQSMAWGFLLGYDTAKDGLDSRGETALSRLRTSCTETPSKTALEILQSLQ